MNSNVMKNYLLDQDKEGNVIAISGEYKLIKINSSTFQADASSNLFTNVKYNDLTDSSIHFNCDKSMFAVFKKDGGIMIINSSDYRPINSNNNNNSNNGVPNNSPSMNTSFLDEIKNISKLSEFRWSPYSPEIFSMLDVVKGFRVLTVFHLQFVNSQNKYSINSYTIDLPTEWRVQTYTWGEQSNLWLKYSILVSSDKGNSLYLIRPVIPKGYKISTKEFIKLSSTLNADAEAIFQRNVAQFGVSRCLIKNDHVTSEIPVNIKGKILALVWSNSKIICFTSEFKINVLLLQELKNYPDTNVDVLSFISVTNRFKQAEKLLEIDLPFKMNFGLSFAHGIFIYQADHVYRLFDERIIIDLAEFPNSKEITEGAKSHGSDPVGSVRGACGNVLLFTNNKIIQIGQHVDSIKRINLESANKEDFLKFVESFDQKVIQRKLNDVQNEASALQIRQTLIDQECEALKDEFDATNDDENDNFRQELNDMDQKGKGLQRRMHDLLEKIKAKRFIEIKGKIDGLD